MKSIICSVLAVFCVALLATGLQLIPFLWSLDGKAWPIVTAGVALLWVLVAFLAWVLMHDEFEKL